MFVGLNNDGSLIVATTIKDKVELRKESGFLIRAIGNRDATGAKFSSAGIFIVEIVFNAYIFSIK